MEWMIICIVVVAISCFFIGFCIRRSNNNRQNEVILANTDISKDLSISHSSYQINSKVLKGFNNPFQRDASVFMASCRVAKRKSNSFKSNSFGKSRIQNLTISKTNLIINNNIGIGRALQNKYGSLKIVENINFDVIDNRHYCSKAMSFFRRPGIFSRRLEELEKIEKQEIAKMKQRLSRRYRKIKSKIKDMSAPKPIYENVKEDDIKKLDK